MISNNQIDQTNNSVSNLIQFIKTIYKIEKPNLLTFKANYFFIQLR